jgi:YD repeat-containing protein
VAITSKAAGTRTAIQYDGLDRWAVITDAGKEVRYRWCGQELCAALDTAGKAKAHYFGDRGMYVLLANGQAQRVAFVTDHLGSARQYHDMAGKWLLSLDDKPTAASAEPTCRPPASACSTAAGLCPAGQGCTCNGRRDRSGGLPAVFFPVQEVAEEGSD